MNWGRGFFRMWIALSAGWIIFELFVFIQQIRALDSPVRLHPGPGGTVHEIPGDTPRDKMHEALTVYFKEQAAKTPTPPPGSELRAAQLLDHATLELDPVDYDKIVDQMMAGYEPRTVSGALFDFVKLALGPPVALFLVGWTLLWVGTGFRRSAP